MKKTHFYCLCLCTLFLTACSSGVQKITLNGSFAGLNKDTLYLFSQKPFEEGDDLDRPQILRDTIPLQDGKFSFKKEIKEPTIFRLIAYTENRPVPIAEFFLSEGLTEIIAKDSALTDIEIKGQTEQKNFEAYKKQIEVLNKRNDSLNGVAYELQTEYAKFRTSLPKAKQSEAKLPKALQDKIDAFTESSKALYKEIKKIDSAYITQNKSSYVSAFLLERFMQVEADKKTLHALIQQLDEKIKKSHFVQRINAIEKLAANLEPGRPAPDFTLPTNKDNETLALSSLKGKIVVLDFWASWCGPCRHVNPELVKLYEKKYKSNDKVAFLGISLDNEKDKWLKAIDKDKLAWLHVSDLKGWESKAAKLYNIHAIPATYIVDAQGNIAAKSVHFENLEKTLDSLLK